MAHYPATVAGYQSGGTGCRVEFRIGGWPSIGKRSAALPFQVQVLLAMGPASFASLSLMNSEERLSLRLLPAGSDVGWKSLLTM